MRCLVRPETGREHEGPLRRAEVPKRVVVVGGGPGGMESALAAARRGHDVVLLERRELRLSGFGTVAVAFGLVPEDRLARELEGNVPLRVVGDAREPGSALEALHEGYGTGAGI